MIRADVEINSTGRVYKLLGKVGNKDKEQRDRGYELDIKNVTLALPSIIAG